MTPPKDTLTDIERDLSEQMADFESAERKRLPVFI